MKVLIVDNSTLFHEILEDIFSDSDMEPVICNNAAEALQKLAQQQFEFVCVSMYLDDSDGISLTKKIRLSPQHKHTPIILFTAEESSGLYVEALSSGVTEVFHKKDVQQLVNFIHRFTLQQQPLSGRVLYVEDTLSQRQMITQVFTSRGLQVDAFASAEEAWQSFFEQDYDLVVTDIVLEGGMTGMALTNRIRRLGDEKGDVPILAITGFDDISRRIELFYLGVSDYVIKPLIEEELIARVRNLINNKQFYHEAIKQRKRAEQADLAKSDFIAQMSHELRTPLNGILGFSQLMMTDTTQPLTDDQQSSLAEISQAGEHLLGLINDILDISKIEAGKFDFNMEPVFIAHAIDNAVNQINSFASQHQITIEPYSINKQIKVNADTKRLHQVLLNLLSNAVKYNTLNGSVQILCKILDDSYVRIGVKDTGLGLTEVQQAELFKPFNRAGQTSNVEGTGLGLVICRRLIEGMGGRINLKSKQGQGTTFWIDLKIES